MKKWMQKLVDQFEFEWGGTAEAEEVVSQISEDRATLLYIIDTYNKHLIEIDSKPVRKVREMLDDFSKQLVDPASNSDRTLFRFRQFFSSYRIDEYSYVLKTFDDFRAIIWDFVDQLADDFENEQKEDQEIQTSLVDLKEAVESNSINDLKSQSRSFIDSYMEFQTRKDERRSTRMSAVKKNLDNVKKKLVDANQSLRKDHLTSAFNRKSFDEKVQQQMQLHKISAQPVSIMMMDIDHFKKVNDTYGHAVGDFVLVECVRVLQELFPRDGDFVARIGGEEFAIVLPDYQMEHAVKKAETVLSRIRQEALVQDEHTIRFTMSMGIAQLCDGESADQWIKRADEALYEAKNSGRNKFVVAEPKKTLQVA